MTPQKDRKPMKSRFIFWFVYFFGGGLKIRKSKNFLSIHETYWNTFYCHSLQKYAYDNISFQITLVSENKFSQSVQSLSHVQLVVTPWTSVPLQHARRPCPSPTPEACSNLSPSSQWCHPTISSCVIPFSSHLQSFPASWSFPVSQLFVSGGQNIVVSASASVLPMKFRTDFFYDGLVGTPCSPRDSQESSPTPQVKSINSSALSFIYCPTLTSIHDHWKTIALTRRTFVCKVLSLLFNMLSRLVIAFLPRSVF